jgi:outer membrane protein, heavy metal efflux system
MKKAWITILTTSAAIIFTAGAYAAEQTVLTESAVIEKAISNNPGLIAAEKTARSIESKGHKQFFLENPMAGVDYMSGQVSLLNPGTGPMKYFVIEQKIPFPLKFIWKAGGAAAETDAYKYMYEMKKFETIDNARSAYYELYKTIKYIDITGGASAVLKQISGIAFARYNQGVVSQQDVIKADLETDLLENELLTLNRQKEADIQRLRQVTADDSLLTGTAYSLDDPQVPELKAGFDEIRDMALKGAPSVKAAAADKALAENMRNMAIADYLPDLSVQYRRNMDPASSGYELMVEAEVPLWFLNNQQANIGENWEMAASKDNGLEDEKNRVVFEAKDHFEAIKADYRLIDLYKNKLIPQAEAGLKSAMASYQSKKIEFMTLLDSERMLLDMKKDYYMRLMEYLTHYRMLEELSGKLD